MRWSTRPWRIRVASGIFWQDHVSIYTPELVERICGTPKAKFLKIAAMIAECSSPTKTMTSMYALGWTQHSVGSQNIRCMAMLQLILGNIGVRGGGMNALRGHSNIQGLTDVGLMSNMLPGYMTLPTEKEADFTSYMKTRAYKPLRPGQTSYWQNYKKFFVSFQKAMYGDAATPANDFAYDWLPKMDVPTYDILRAFELMHQGKMTGYFCQGFNPLQAFPNRKKISDSLSKLKFLVVMDPLDTETARFWEKHGDINDVDPAAIQTEVIQLPSTCFAEDDGSLTNSGRWLQWHWPGSTPPGEAKRDTWIMAQLYLRLKELYQKEGGAFADPILNLAWPYADPGDPTAAETCQGDQRQGARDGDGSGRSIENCRRGGQARAELRRLARRWLDGLRLLDLFRLLQRERQQYGPPRHVRTRTVPAPIRSGRSPGR